MVFLVITVFCVVLLLFFGVALLRFPSAVNLINFYEPNKYDDEKFRKYLGKSFIVLALVVSVFHSIFAFLGEGSPYNLLVVIIYMVVLAYGCIKLSSLCTKKFLLKKEEL